MPKVIELTVELNVEKVSCPGVWLCQDGRVSLNIFALDTTYQTCLVPPIFPLIFNDVFYFRKRFQDTACSLNNFCCLLKDETIYCELVQFCNDCGVDKCTVLAQYLGSLNDVLFPSNMCTSEGVDLLMRRSNKFPGILSPKVEVKTKMRLDELWANHSSPTTRTRVTKPCKCPPKDTDATRQKTVCHTPLYHRIRCTKRSDRSRSRSRDSRSRSEASRSLCSVNMRDPERDTSYECPSKSRGGSARKPYQVLTAQSIPNWIIPDTLDAGKENGGYFNRKSSDVHRKSLDVHSKSYDVPRKPCDVHSKSFDVPRKPYDVHSKSFDVPRKPYDVHSKSYDVPRKLYDVHSKSFDVHRKSSDVYKTSYDVRRNSSEEDIQTADEQRSIERIILESHHIEQECDKFDRRMKKITQHKPKGPCTCEICRRYHQLFSSKTNCDSSVYYR